MFFRRRRRSFLLKWLLILFGFRLVQRGRLTEEERTNYKSKAKKFRRKLREAYAVWDDDEEDSELQGDGKA